MTGRSGLQRVAPAVHLGANLLVAAVGTRSPPPPNYVSRGSRGPTRLLMAISRRPAARGATQLLRHDLDVHVQHLPRCRKHLLHARDDGRLLRGNSMKRVCGKPSTRHVVGEPSDALRHDGDKRLALPHADLFGRNPATTTPRRRPTACGRATATARQGVCRACTTSAPGARPTPATGERLIYDAMRGRGTLSATKERW